MSSHVHVSDRAALTEANELIARFGEFAGSEAASRADRSRNVGNIVHFCRWKQIERVIDMLRDPLVSGALH